MRKNYRLTESRLRGMIREAVKNALSEGLNDPIELTDDNHELVYELERIAKDWFNNWKRGLQSRLFGIRYADKYINVFETDDNYAQRLGETILNSYYDDEMYRDMNKDNASIVGKTIYRLMKKFRDSEQQARTDSIKQKRGETKRNKDRATHMSRFNGYSPEVKGQMDDMWNDYLSDPHNPSNDSLRNGNSLGMNDEYWEDYQY